MEVEGDDTSPQHRAVSPEPTPDTAITPPFHWLSGEPIPMGGEIETSAFALLDGVVYGKNLKSTADCTRIRVPITRIPATLGRSHETKDSSFFGLTAIKALSREQCRIYFQEPNGGRFVLQHHDNDSGGGSSDNKFVYQPPPKATNRPRNVILLDPDRPLPTEGFFAIECVGKNKITVGKNRVEQGQIAQLDHGTKIRMSTLCLLFMLPTDNKRVTMEIAIAADDSSTGVDATGTSASSLAASNKRKRPASSNNDGPDTKRQSSSSGVGNVAIIQELELLSSDELLAEISEAIDAGMWERRHQLSGGVIAYHAVNDASRSKAIRKLVRDNGGVSRKEIMDWMQASTKYSHWVNHTLDRVELSSFQSTVSRVLLKAGYERLGKNGRYVKWKLPPSAEDESEVSDLDVESGGEQSEDASAKASDNDVTMDDVAHDEHEASGEDDDDDDHDSNGDDESKPKQTVVAESKEEASDHDSDSSDADEQLSRRRAPSMGDDAVENDGSNDGEEASSVSSGDEKTLDGPAAVKTGRGMDDGVESDESSESPQNAENRSAMEHADEQAMSSDASLK